ncbi:MAG: CPBP family intramembrane metalloprotease [Bacteroidales bacterium]|jgi:membrane protease YdiL (CAAX protease family)|nr:CPBP family intramembrane metalloprotease [Bacteroidales bacterium]
MKERHKILWVFLIGGILLYLGGILWHALSTVVGSPEPIIPQERLWQMFHALPLVGVLLLVGLQPILEEFAFRFWATGRKYARYISLSGMTAFSALALPNCYWVAAITAILFFYLFFVLKNQKMQLIVATVASSLLFGLVHIRNEVTVSMKIATIIQITGMGLILLFTVLRFRFIWAVVLHILNNLLITLIHLLLPSASITFSDTDYQATLTPLTLFSSSDNNPKFQEDTICLNNYLADMAASIARSCRNTPDHYSARSNNLRKYNLQVYAKPRQAIDREDFLRRLLEITPLKTDTVERLAHILHVVDSLKLAQTAGDSGIEITSVINRFRDKYNIFLIVEDDSLHYKYFPDMGNLWGIQNCEEAKLYLENYGLAIKENDLRPVKQIYFIED